MNFENYNQKKLRLFHYLFLALYYVIGYLGPVIFSVICVCNASVITDKWRFPIILSIIMVVFVLIAIRVFKKSIDKINILNIDGTYNKKAVITKSILGFLGKVSVPIIVIVAVILCSNILVGKIESLASGAIQVVHLYELFIIVNASFLILAGLIEKFFLDPIETEIELRNKVSEQNALDRRINNLKNINK